ncbi:MAG: hypothetical protein ACI91J_002513 [Yoonia sp.]
MDFKEGALSIVCRKAHLGSGPSIASNHAGCISNESLGHPVDGLNRSTETGGFAAESNVET